MKQHIRELLSRSATPGGYKPLREGYETRERRANRQMCIPCIHGKHAHCDSEDCPCACNDSDFRFARNKLTATGAIPIDMAKLAQHWGHAIDSATVCPTVAKS